MKRLTCVLALGSLALACGKMRGGGGGGGSDDGTGPILVGEYGSMSGAQATFGQSTHNGIMLAVKEINAAGGVPGRGKARKLEVKTYDDQGKSQEAGTAVTRLITQDKVTALLGEVASSLSMAGGQVAQHYGVPMITPSSTNVLVTEVGDMVSRVCFIDSFQGWVMAKFASDNLKAKKVAVLYDQAQAYSVGLKEDFKKAFTAAGGAITSEQAYDSGAQDFNAQLTTIRGTAPDAIYVPGYYTDVGNVALQARKLGLTVPLLGGDGWDSSKLYEIAGEAIIGSYYSNHYSPDEERPEVQNFVKSYKAEYGATPDGLAALGYDATKLLADAMGRAKSLSGKDLAQAINDTKDFRGVTGVISIDAKRNAKKPAVIVQMKGGKPTFVTSIAPPQ